jgi:hypothetical protein
MLAPGHGCSRRGTDARAARKTRIQALSSPMGVSLMLTSDAVLWTLDENLRALAARFNILPG